MADKTDMTVNTEIRLDATQSNGARQRESQPAERMSATFFSSLAISLLTGALLLGTLIYLAGPWALLANTRVLNLLIGGGVVKYHDRQAGFIEGVPNHEYYLASQDPINWTIILLVIGAYLLLWSLKAIQFHNIARYYGIKGSFNQHARAYFYGLNYKETQPFSLGNAATAAALRTQGAPLDRTRAALFLFQAFFLFEIAVLALVGLLGIGWAAWLNQILVALILIGGLYLWTRAGRTERANAGPPSFFGALGNHFGAVIQNPLTFLYLAVLSLLAFELREVAAYLTTMAFSTQHVLLNIDPVLILMGLVSGHIATLIRLTPGGIGQFEWGFAGALFIGGVGLPEAATVALLVSGFRYVALLVLYLATLFWRGARTSFRDVVQLTTSREWQAPVAATPGNDAAPAIHAVPAQPKTNPALLWSRALIVGWVMLGIYFFDQLTILLSDLWLLESLQMQSVFATNFSASAILFSVAFLYFTALIAAPAFIHPVAAPVRRFMVTLATAIGLIAGYLMGTRYLDYLIVNRGAFGATDPIFGHDIGFYVFTLPAIWTTWHAMVWCCGLALAASVAGAHLAPRKRSRPGQLSPLVRWLEGATTPYTLFMLALGGLVLAGGVWLTRFDLLFKDNYNASVFTGASFVDVNGLFSTLNQIHFTAAVVLGVTALLVVMLTTLRRAAQRNVAVWSGNVRTAGLAAVALIGADFVFAAIVAVRDSTLVAPNQPVIQLEYIQRHIDATRTAYGLNAVETVVLTPNGAGDPLPDIERLMASPSLRNAPLWPAFASYLERLVDPQHADRILKTGDNLIYGPTLEIFRQQQKLRTYYDFLEIDTLRFQIDGEMKVFASAVRELPILEPQPWLAWWGQRFMLFTHGHGLVMAPIGALAGEGEPVFATSNIPVQTQWPELEVQNPQIYYGKGAGSMAVSNVRDMQEFDYPTERGRAENVLPAEVAAGVPVDSLLKRVVFGWRSGEFVQMIFSSLITPETRIHYYRKPIERLERIVPFLYLDSNAYATIADGEIIWIANAVTTSAHYPYSRFEYIGDKSISRTRETIETRRLNYVEDSVKATLNAYTGQVEFYKIADAPVINAWARVYPGLFRDGSAMPDSVRQQLTYPVHLFHTLFDDIYIYYHMDEPMYFFNMEDMWDDSDEVLGPILDQGKAITFSIEPHHMVVETGGVLPVTETGAQFVMTFSFTPEGARNLRAVPMVYQDGADYGRLVVLEAPKSHYVLGVEQADAIIDQDPAISEKISWWNRTGNEVIRGHTTLMLIDNELFYIEPIFVRSQQNPVTQLKRVAVVFRGQAYSGETLEAALRLALERQAATAGVDNQQ